MDFGAVLMALSVTAGIKVIVLALTVRLLYRFYGSAYSGRPSRLWYLLPKEDLPEIRLLWWSLFAFFFSEAFCGVETYIIFRSSAVFRALHAISSAIGMGLFSTGLYLYLDKKIIRYGEPSCIVNRICSGCPKLKGAPCKFRMASFLVATFLLFLCIPPFFASTEIMRADPSRFVLPFPALNAWYEAVIAPKLMSLPGYQPIGISFFLPSSTQILDFRVIPGVAAILILIGILDLRAYREKRALTAIAFGLGMLSYSYLELLLNRGTGDLFIGAIGHEVAEFWFLLLLAEFLRRAFPAAETRGQSSSESPAPEAAPV